MSDQNIKALKAAFPHTLPVLFGFTFLGITYGVLMNSAGFSVLSTLAISLVCYAGSVQFVLVTLLLSAFHPLSAFFMALMINARHLFYGVSMLGKYKNTGRIKWYLIYTLCDETFSVNYAAAIPPDVNRTRFYFFVTFLNQLYWVVASVLGGIFGSFIPFDTTGIDFALTAMFVVIFLENFLKEKDHTASCLGLGLSLLSLIVFGEDRFIIPAMVMLILSLTVLRTPLERRIGECK